ncbi:MAG: T9SS type A sorting domain-containing protein [Bacteroidetes bacterium]|nr:T9SS type A sorting domain-containing protein [Bacteroidota bacterium]
MEGFWSGPYSISTSYPSSDWFPSLASAGGSPDPDIYLTYDARWYSQIYSQVYDASTDSWSGETVVYDGSAQTSYDRQSCIAVDGTHTFDAWNSQDWNLNGIYIVRFREGSTNGTWGSWEWSYTDGTESQWYPSISDYDYGTYLGMTEYGATSDDIFLQVADIGSQTWQEYTEASSGTNSVLPEETNASGSAVPRVFWTGTAQNSTYQITSANQNLPTTLKTGHPSIVASVGGPQFQIYNRALNGPGVRVQFGDVSATTAQGLTKLIPLKSFDYAKPADLSDPWSYLETDDSVLTTGVASVSFNLSISTADSRRDSVKVANAVVAPTPVEVSVYDGQNLIFDRPLKDTSSVLNLKITATPTNGTIAGLRPVVKFETSNGNPDSVVFNTVENMFVPQSLQPKNEQVMSQIPLTFSLSQNYPNPFNPTTRVDYTIAKAGMVSLKVYDVLGREVETIVNENEQPGRYSVNFDGSHLASGVYFYRLEAGSNVITKKMLLMK